MWTPSEVRKLVAQIAGIIFGCGGIYLIIIDAKATGKINLSTNFISGEIESGSAGVLLLFFSSFLILLPLYGRKQQDKENISLFKSSIFRGNLIVRLGFVLAVVALALLATYLAMPGQMGGVLYGIGMLLFIFFIYGGLGYKDN